MVGAADTFRAAAIEQLRKYVRQDLNGSILQKILSINR